MMGFTGRIVGAAAVFWGYVAVKAAPPTSRQVVDEHNRDHANQNGGERGLSNAILTMNTHGHFRNVDEGMTIKPIKRPLKQSWGDWEKPGKGISMDSTGEPKSGTTWTERITTELALHLCGSETNKWCMMGGLKVIPNKPDPSYIWELLRADTGELFIHFNGEIKHEIPGFQAMRCLPKGHSHPEGFARVYPCVVRHGEPFSREQLLKCLPTVTSDCASIMPSRYPDQRRMSVVFRDSRDVIISSHRYKIMVGKKGIPDLETYISQYFEIVVAWQHQRWVWHTTFYREASHVMFYEDLKGSHLSLMDLAAFMGLDCTPEQAREVWDLHQENASHLGYDSIGLPIEKIEFMNATMSKLLPVDMLTRYGLTPTDSSAG